MKQLLIPFALLTLAAAPANKLPITTRSEKAKQFFIESRNLAEGLRTEAAIERCKKALAEDPDFALANIDLAELTRERISLDEYYQMLDRAVRAAKKTTRGEQLFVEAIVAGGRGDSRTRIARLMEVEKLHPDEERVQRMLADYLLFEEQLPDKAIAKLERIVAASPNYAPAYNSLGYAHMTAERYSEAEQAFKKYVALVPDHPNPHDSYAELLMKMGRFEESIASYERALKADPEFLSSYVGIGHDLLFLGRAADARAAFAKLASGGGPERRNIALTMNTLAFVFEGETDLALAEAAKVKALAEAEKKPQWLGRALRLTSNILLEAGRTKDALAQIEKRQEVIRALEVPAELKAQLMRTVLFDKTRVALAEGDLARARSNIEMFGKELAKGSGAYEETEHHELLGRLAFAEKKYNDALSALAKAAPSRPHVVFLQAQIYAGLGDAAQARAYYRRVVEYNGLDHDYAYVRKKARQMLANS